LDKKKSLANSTWALQLCDHQIISIFCWKKDIFLPIFS
jgi:hypothetical protein